MIAEGLRQLRQSAAAEIDRLNAVIAGLDQLLAMAPAAPVFGPASPVPPVAAKPPEPVPTAHEVWAHAPARAAEPKRESPAEEVPLPGKAKPPAKDGPASGAVERPREGSVLDEIAKLLAANGPMRRVDIAAARGCTAAAIYPRLKSPLFENPNRRYQLSPLGRRLYGLPETPPPPPEPSSDPTDPKAIAAGQVKAIAAVLAKRPLQDIAAIADLADLPVEVVRRRLISNGIQAPAGCEIFSKSESGQWGLTAKGRALAEAA